jgi:hypothetical protein
VTPIGPPGSGAAKIADLHQGQVFLDASRWIGLTKLTGRSRYAGRPFRFVPIH